jgi:hypothetical protein
VSRAAIECESKTAYDDSAAADRARLVAIHQRGARSTLTSYRCRFGAHWHIGHAGAGANGRAAPNRRRGRRRA